MGGKIDKKLTLLETFLLDDGSEKLVKEDELPVVDRSQLIRRSLSLEFIGNHTQVKNKF